MELSLQNALTERLDKELRLRCLRLLPSHFVLLIFASLMFWEPFSLGAIALSLLARTLVIKRNIRLSNKVNSYVLTPLVSLTGLAWGIYFQLIQTHNGLLSIESIFSIGVIVILMSGGVTAFSTHRRVAFAFITAISVIPIYTLFFSTHSKFLILGCLFLYSYFYHLYHCKISYKNISSLIKAEIKEGEERHYLQGFIDALPGFVAFIDKDRKYRIVNNFDNGFYRSWILGKEVLSLEPNSEIAQAIAQFIESDDVSDSKEIMSVLKGEATWSLVSFKRVPELEGSVVSVTPITELVKTRNELKKQEEKAQIAARLASLGEVAAGIAHEINNPLTIIEGSSYVLRDLIQEEQIDRPSVKKMVTKISETTQRIAKIILSLKKLSKGDEHYPSNIVSLTTVLEPCMEMSWQRLNRYKIELKVTDCAKEAHLYCRDIELSQVLLNLISNSIDAVSSSEERWIKIDFKSTKSWDEIFVIDSGKGVPLENKDKIMEPFFTTKNKHNGTGLGLSISKGIIESHNGEISYLPEEKNTTFKIKIPKLDQIKKNDFFEKEQICILEQA